MAKTQKSGTKRWVGLKQNRCRTVMDIKNIEEAIYQFENQRFSNFPKHIENHESLSLAEKKLTIKIWEESSRHELWNHSSLNKGKKYALSFLKENYSLSEKACNELVQAISYEWM